MSQLTIEDYRNAKKEIEGKIFAAIKEFKTTTGIFPTKIEYKPLVENTKSGDIVVGHDLNIRIDLF